MDTIESISYASGENDIEQIALDVQSDLECLDVEELWDNSGTTRYGYIEPGEMAWEMFENAMDNHEQQMKNLEGLGMQAEASNYCMGILKGIYLFEHASSTEFKDWAVDAPSESFSRILKEWKNKHPDNIELKEMGKFLDNNCKNWVKAGPMNP